jgi:hypothetical protein
MIHRRQTISIPNRPPTTCDLQITNCGNQRYIVVMMERDDNNGMSVTNASEEIATHVMATWLVTSDLENAHPSSFRWVEHYPRTPKRKAEETWDIVSYTWRKRGNVWVASAPVWTSFRNQQAIARLRDDLPVPDSVFETDEEAILDDIALSLMEPMDNA